MFEGPANGRDFTSIFFKIKEFNKPHKGFRQGVLEVRCRRKTRGERRPSRKRPVINGKSANAGELLAR
jgi:hypothetical protein